MSTTKIEWTATRLPDGTVLKGKSFNTWQGCHKVSPACKNCYAETMANRFAPGHWGLNAPRKLQEEGYWKKPHSWNRTAKKKGIRIKVFSNSMSDLFERHPDADMNAVLHEQRQRLFNLTTETPYLDYLFLTKRIDNVLSMVPSDWLTDWPVNVWQGTTIENQEQADKRIPELLKVPAKIHFVSMEPLLESVDLSKNIGGTLWIGGQRGCDGTHRHRGRAGDIIHDVFHETDPNFLHHHHDDRCKKGIDWVIAGRLLDGREHNDMPDNLKPFAGSRV
jgi:protein gp37